MKDDLVEVSGLNGGVDEDDFEMGFAKSAGKGEKRERSTERRAVVRRIKEDHLATGWATL
jgi:hypothetical protein